MTKHNKMTETVSNIKLKTKNKIKSIVVHQQ